MKTALMFGAGNVGRGFLGQLFHESGYEVVFIDIDLELINALDSTQSYPLHLVNNESRLELTIAPVRGVLASDTEKIADFVAAADIGATAVGARALPAVAPIIAKGIKARAKRNGSPLNFIICENLKDAANTFRNAVASHLPNDSQTYFTSSIGFVDTVIGRMIPPPTPEMRALDPRLIQVEPYKELPVDQNGFVGEIPHIVGMLPSDNFEVFTARKLYIHNCGHAVLAYLGYLRHYNYGYEALEDPEILARLEATLDESQAGIVSRYQVNDSWLFAHRKDLLYRFANRTLGDTIFRLGRDPLRKLAPNDRLVGPARLAESAGLTPGNLAKAIAAAYCFSPVDDPLAQELQGDISNHGMRDVLFRVSGIKPNEPLGELILTEYTRLTTGNSI